MDVFLFLMVNVNYSDLQHLNLKKNEEFIKKMLCRNFE
jgi:hypothetical protein